jgi:hypothetical protein
MKWRQFSPFLMFPVLAAAGSPAGVGPIPTCGYKDQVVCPICTPNDPGSCYCGPYNSTECWCLKAAGVVQTGNRVTCNTNDFSWISDPNGLQITTAEVEVACGKSYKCSTPAGNEYNCATWTGSACVPTGEGGCAWRLLSSWTYFTVQQGAACNP